MTEKLVIIGAGMASGRVLDHLLAQAPNAYDITLFNAEPRGNYNRLMLSPVLAGEKTYPEIITHDTDWYATNSITCRFGEKVLSIDPIRKEVVGEGGKVSYDKIVLGTGSNPFMIPLPGHDMDGVIAYRDLEDTRRMIALGERPGARAVVIGGGLLGLEAAAGLRSRGVEVTVVHIMGHLMERQLDPAAATLLQQALEARGITVLCNANSKQILGEDGKVTGLELDDGTVLPCDLLVMAVGIRPSTQLAKDTGLTVERGVVVNDQMITSDPDILAVGECVEHNGQLFGLVAPLYDQAEVVAKTLLGIEAKFVNKEVSTKLKVTGCDLFSAGDFATGEDREDIILHDRASGFYKRLILKENKVIGAVMYGDTSDGGWFYNLIRDGQDVAAIRDMLIFGPGFQGGQQADPYGGRCSLTA
jgi:nitrite reductase (NADH) large subunit